MTEEKSLIESAFDLMITDAAKTFLKEIAKWTNFLSIIGFIMVGLFAFLGIGMSIAMVGSNDFMSPVGIPGFLFGIIYFFLAAIYFFPIYYLFKFSKNLKKALIQVDNDALTDAIRFLKSHYKFIGILTIIMMALYFLFFTIGIFASLA